MQEPQRHHPPAQRHRQRLRQKEKTEGDTTAQEENKEESKTEASGDTVTLKLSNNQPDGTVPL